MVLVEVLEEALRGAEASAGRVDADETAAVPRTSMSISRPKSSLTILTSLAIARREPGKEARERAQEVVRVAKRGVPVGLDSAALVGVAPARDEGLERVLFGAIHFLVPLLRFD